MLSFDKKKCHIDAGSSAGIVWTPTDKTSACFKQSLQL